MISMAVVPICYKMSYKDQPLLNSKEVRHDQKGFLSSFAQEDCGCFSPISSETGRRWSNDATGIPLKVNTRKGAGVSQGMIYNRGSTMFEPMIEVSVKPAVAVCHLRSRFNNASQRDKRCIVCHAYKSNSNEKQLQSLDIYFGKLQHDASKPSSVSLNKKEEFIDQGGPFKTKSVLGSLDDYFGKVSKDANSKNYVSSASDDEAIEAPSYSVRGGSGRGGWKKLKSYMRLKNKDGEDGSKLSFNETSDLHFISILVSINIAVFLFEIASPIQNSDLELFSLPLLYGAKINHLILLGEWWRLLTPMFLVQD